MFALNYPVKGSGCQAHVFLVNRFKLADQWD